MTNFYFNIYVLAQKPNRLLSAKQNSGYHREQYALLAREQLLASVILGHTKANGAGLGRG